MTILDTNVLSEVVKPRPEPVVMEWLSLQAFHDVYLTSITMAEVLHGLERMPAGKRRAALKVAVEGLFQHEFAGRILPFDEMAALNYGQLVTEREKAGRPMQPFDAQIAAIARQHGATVATRNTPHFEQSGVALVNPWDGLEPATTSLRSAP